MQISPDLTANSTKPTLAFRSSGVLPKMFKSPQSLCNHMGRETPTHGFWSIALLQGGFGRSCYSNTHTPDPPKEPPTSSNIPPKRGLTKSQTTNGFGDRFGGSNYHLLGVGPIPTHVGRPLLSAKQGQIPAPSDPEEASQAHYKHLQRGSPGWKPEPTT